jgi:Holliday junction resolvasome RuvABC endonuclease subunit
LPRRTEPHVREVKLKKKRRPPAKTTWRTVGDRARVLALDPSSVCVGWAIYEHGKLKDFGRYLQVGREHGERLINYIFWLQELFNRVKPTTVVYEAPFQGRHRNAFAVLSMYRGAIIAAHFDVFGRELADRNAIPAHLIKRVLGVPKGTHDENKKAVIEVINKKHGLSLKWATGDTKKQKSQDDVADAIAVGDVYHALHEANPEADDG